MSKKLISLAYATAVGCSRQIRQRNLAKNAVVLGVLLGFLALPISVYALGFGGIKLNSALNEPFDAEIELLSATAADVEGLQVKVADRNAFARAGVDRPSFLNKIKFKVERRSSGSYFVRMTTVQPVREPFMNFLLEMDWPNGRMLREYTVLLDPPDLFHRQPTVVQSPETEPPAEVIRIEPEPLAVEPELAPEPSVQTAPEPLFIPEPEPVAAEPEPTPIAEPEPELAPAPEPVAEIAPEPTPEPIPEPAPIAEEQLAVTPEPEPFVEDQLFPLIPLSDYREPRDSDFDQPAGVTDFSETETAPEFQVEELTAEPPITGDLDHGLTRKGDNLWTIAEKMRPSDSTTIYQVMMALVNSNPEAFVDGNVHRMKVGHVMRISDPSLLSAMSSQEAAAEYRRQTEAWDQFRESVAQVETTEQPLLAGDTETPVAEVATTEPQGELTVEPTSGEASVGGGVQEQAEAQSEELIALRDEVNQAVEQARNDPNAGPEQHARLGMLMEELERLERMVTIEDEQLAALQAELGKIEEAKLAAAAEAAAAPAPEEQAPAEEVATEAAPAMEEDAGTETGMAPTDEVPAESDAVSEAEVIPAEEDSDAAPEQMAGAEVDAPQATTPPVAETPAEQPEEPGIVGQILGWLGGIGGFFAGLVGALTGNPMMIGIAAAVIIVLLLGVVILRRRRASADAGESILTGDATAAPAVAAAEVAGPVSEESSFLSDFAISGMNAIQAEDTEVDPVTEADVFMAYGRYEAAEERLKDAIRNEPGRNELKLKLIELFYTTKNKPQFEAAAEELYAALGDDAAADVGWEKVLGMGAELASDNPLFKAAAEAGASSDSIDVGSSMTESEIMDIGLDTGIFQSQELSQETPVAEVSGAETMVTSSDNLDFNLDTALEPDTQSTGSSEMALDLGGMGLDFDENTQAVTESEAAAASSEGGAGEARDSKPSEAFDLDTTFAEPTKSEEFDLGMDAGTVKSEEFDLAGGMESQEFELGPETSQEFELDLPDTTSVDLGAKADDALLDMNLEAADAVDTDLGGAADEVGTKLDLAKAYIDMGDPDGARSILDEVLEEGDNTQKQEAQQLMQEIG